MTILNDVDPRSRLSDMVREKMRQDQIDVDELSEQTGVPAHRLRQIVEGQAGVALLSDMVALATYFGSPVDSLLR